MHALYPLATTSIHPQKASGTPAHFFFRPKTVSQWPKTTKHRQNTTYFEIFCAIFSTEKVRGGCARPVPTCNYLNPPPESLRNLGALFFRPKTLQNGQKRPKTVKIRIILRYFALFLAHKSARRVRTPRDHLKLPQTTHRKPQEPRRTLFSAQNNLKMAKNDQNTPYFEIFCAIFSAKKVRGGCARPVPT